MSDRFFDGRRMNNNTLGNLTRYNTSINETIKSIEENDKKDFNWKTLGLGIGSLFLFSGATYGTHRLSQYFMYERPERIRRETPPEINVETRMELE